MAMVERERLQFFSGATKGKTGGGRRHFIVNPRTAVPLDAVRMGPMLYTCIHG
jgi:hypothetical protein